MEAGAVRYIQPDKVILEGENLPRSARSGQVVVHGRCLECFGIGYPVVGYIKMHQSRLYVPVLRLRISKVAKPELEVTA